jgi:hypothetical protein
MRKVSVLAGHQNIVGAKSGRSSFIRDNILMCLTYFSTVTALKTLGKG